MAIKYNEVKTGEMLKWEKPGIVVEGILESYEHKTNLPKGDGDVYEVRTKDGMIAFFAPMLLHKKLTTVPLGNIVRIEFTSLSRTNSGNDLKNFSVSFAEATPANLKSLGIEILKEVADVNPNDVPVN
jgi:hypothetical protein